MNTDVGERRLLLRADILHHGSPIVAYTVAISEASVFVQTDANGYIGEQIDVRLSFPSLVEPFDLHGHIVSTHRPTAPGDPGGWTVAFVFRSDADQLRLKELLTRVDSAHQAFAQPEAESEPYRVLLVEDNSMTRDVYSYGVARYFRGRTNRVQIDLAADAEQAKVLLDAAAYDLAIIDYYLPSVNGDSLIAWLRAKPRMSSMAVVAVSVGGPEAREATLAAGADLFLDKPVVVRDLFSTLERLTVAAGAV